MVGEVHDGWRVDLNKGLFFVGETWSASQLVSTKVTGECDGSCGRFEVLFTVGSIRISARARGNCVPVLVIFNVSWYHQEQAHSRGSA